MTSQLRTLFLMALLSGLILLMGKAMGGNTGLIIAAAIALLMNFGSYWFSDKIVLKTYRAREVSEVEAPMLYAMVKDLAHNAGVPMPKVCVVPEAAPNAFATGRNPEHAVVAVTEGILRILSPDELRGVIAHEIGHIVNRDILIQSMVGVMATVVMYLGNMLQWAAIFGGGRSSDSDNGGAGFLGSMLLAILAPIAAAMVQFGISRSREYLADEAGARISGSPRSLASALAKLDAASRQIPMKEGSPATESMFIVNPFSSAGLQGLFSTHPPIAERIRRLEAMAGGR